MRVQPDALIRKGFDNYVISLHPFFGQLEIKRYEEGYIFDVRLVGADDMLL